MSQTCGSLRSGNEQGPARRAHGRSRIRDELRRREWKAYLDDAHYGKGWRIYEFEGRQLIYHAGWVAGYVAEIAYSPELNLGMAMLMNGESRVIAELGANYWHQVFEKAKSAETTVKK